MNNDGKNPLFQLAEVIEIVDSKDGDRIKAKPITDSHLFNKDVPYAFPLLPKMLHIKPKLGEKVLLFTLDKENNYSQRFYIGPVITQQTHMYNEPSHLDAEALFQGAYEGVDIAPTMEESTLGAFPENDDISIEGRKNCGLQITDNDIRLKAGVKKTNVNGDERQVIFNRENPAFINLKYNDSLQNTNQDFKSVAYIVADRINILGNNPTGRAQSFKTDNDTKYSSHLYDETALTEEKQKILSHYTSAARNLVTDKELNDLLDETNGIAYRLPYGDLLIEFLKQFRDAFINHVHPFPTMKPCQTEEIKNLANYNLDELLSNTVRIN